MVSLWPWNGDENSPASFEKALSALSTRISKLQTQQDLLRQRNRRYKAIWTLYTSFAYMLCLVLAFLVLGWKNMTAWEYTGLSGAPVVIYLVRTAISAYYNFRIDSTTQRLEEQQAERTKTITKLKAATKYDSTQLLLEKYGGATPKPVTKQRKPSAPRKQKSQNLPQRTGTGPPATANIPRPQSQPTSPENRQNQAMSPFLIPSPVFSRGHAPQQQKQQIGSPQEEFAPSAFSAPPQYANSGEYNPGGHWYDRVLDLLLGEDETLPRNRISLVCQNCRLVNGLAPPGTMNLAHLGKWRCIGCHTMNGEEDEATKVVQEMKERIETHEEEQLVSASEEKSSAESGVLVGEENEEDDDDRKSDVEEEDSSAEQSKE